MIRVPSGHSAVFDLTVAGPKSVEGVSSVSLTMPSTAWAGAAVRAGEQGAHTEQAEDGDAAPTYLKPGPVALQCMDHDVPLCRWRGRMPRPCRVASDHQYGVSTQPPEVSAWA